MLNADRPPLLGLPPFQVHCWLRIVRFIAPSLVVDAAVSLIMLQSHNGRDNAVELLHLAAKASNRKIQEIANDIIHGANLPSA